MPRSRGGDSSADDELQSGSQLRCIEILGGNVRRAEALLLGGLEVLLIARPTGRGGGGDIYCIHSCGHGALAKFVLVDLTGHGQARDAVARAVHGLLHHYDNETQPAHLLELLNQEYGRSVPPNLLATAVSAVYQPNSAEIRFANAGQPRPFHWSAARRQWSLVSPASDSDCGLPLGVKLNACYTEENVPLDDGDVLFLSSDGLHETRNGHGQFLGPEGILGLLQEASGEVPQGAMLVRLAAAFLRHAERFRQAKEFEDDVTLLWLRRLAVATAQRIRVSETLARSGGSR